MMNMKFKYCNNVGTVGKQILKPFHSHFNFSSIISFHFRQLEHFFMKMSVEIFPYEDEHFVAMIPCLFHKEKISNLFSRWGKRFVNRSCV